MARDNIDRAELADMLMDRATSAEDASPAMAEMIAGFVTEAEAAAEADAGPRAFQRFVPALVPAIRLRIRGRRAHVSPAGCGDEYPEARAMNCGPLPEMIRGLASGWPRMKSTMRSRTSCGAQAPLSVLQDFH
jgi:hypothetical protein